MPNTVTINGVTLTREQVEQAMKDLQAPTHKEHILKLSSTVDLVLVQIPSGEWIAKYPTTQAQFNTFCSTVARSRPAYKFVGDDLPAESVTWYDAQAFAAWLTTVCYRVFPKDCYLAELPHEELWEKASLAGQVADPTPIEDYAWCYENSKGTTHPVGQKKPNAWGLYDMLGNVWEWCGNNHIK